MAAGSGFCKRCDKKHNTGTPGTSRTRQEKVALAGGMALILLGLVWLVLAMMASASAGHLRVSFLALGVIGAGATIITRKVYW